MAANVIEVLWELFILLSFVYLIYQCCIKPGLNRRGRRNENGDHQEDLRRIRERMSERRVNDASGASTSAAGNTTSTAGGSAARKILIDNNIFSRQIRREESVTELAQLLAISRGGEVDVELGLVAAGPVDAPVPADSANDRLKDSGGQPVSDPIKPGLEDTLSESSMPAPTAPELSERSLQPFPSPGSATVTDTIATALSSPQSTSPAITPPNTVSPNQPITMEPIRNLWSNLSHNLPGGDENARASDTRTGKTNALHSHKLECSICLDNYSPNETIAWAKDGGDATTSSSAGVTVNNNMGCDHIFHRDCLVAWLQDHDECPLCRRKVVHDDAGVRFAGWEMNHSEVNV